MRLMSITGSTAGTALAASLSVSLALAGITPAVAAPSRQPPLAIAKQIPQETVTLSIGRGTLVKLPSTMSDIFVASDTVADVQVKSNSQLYIFGKAAGETNVYATNKAGVVVWSATVRVGQNITSVGQMLKLAMPEAAITATPMNGLVLLTGTVASPDDVAEATRLAQAFTGDGVQVVSRLKTATPLQVNVQVRIAEVSRDFMKNVGVNLINRDSGGFLFGIAQGNPGSISTVPGVPGQPNSPVDANGARPGDTLFKFPGAPAVGTVVGAAGHWLGMDLLASLNLAEQNGLVTTLANPNLTALSGETASFLAGGEIPIPISQGLGAVSVEYKQYGVSLAFTPFVLADGRISLRVRPEVSQLTSAGSVTVNGFTVPGLTTRRAETTIELGSGQSFMIGGLLSNTHNNSISKAPGLGDLPVLGALFRSNSFRRSETELVIVVTPYLVKPVDANAIKLPTDGYRSPNDFDRIVGGKLESTPNPAGRPKPTMAPPVTVAPSISTSERAPAPAPARSAPVRTARKPETGAAAAPGFSF